MDAVRTDEADLSDAWVDGSDARWRTATVYSGDASGAFVLELAPGRRLERHTDSAEEAVVVLDGTATIVVGDEATELPRGAVARVPRDVPHEIRNESDDVVRFVGVYASADVLTTYVSEIQPDGEQRRRPLA